MATQTLLLTAHAAGLAALANGVTYLAEPGVYGDGELRLQVERGFGCLGNLVFGLHGHGTASLPVV